MLFFMSVASLVFGLNGFLFRNDGVTWTMPLDLAIFLTVAGGIGTVLFRRPRPLNRLKD